MRNIITKKAYNKRKDVVSKLRLEGDEREKSTLAVNPDFEKKRKEYLEKPELARILEMLRNSTTEQLQRYRFEYNLERHGHVEVTNLEWKKNLEEVLEARGCAIIPYKPGEGATHSVNEFETYERSITGGNLVIPLDLGLLLKDYTVEKMICESMGRLVEVVERLFLLATENEGILKSNSDFASNFARVVKTGGEPMQRFMREALKHQGRAKGSVGMEVLFPIAKRLPNQFIPLLPEVQPFSFTTFLKKRNQRNGSAFPSVVELREFFRAVERESKHSKKIETISEMVGIIHELLGKYARNIYLVADIQNDSSAQQIFNLLTRDTLASQMKHADIHLKVFAPKAIIAERKDYMVLDNMFNWTDELILEMLDKKIQGCESDFNLFILKTDEFDYIAKILEYAQRNPKRALLVTSALLDEIEDFRITASSWNKMCANWQHSTDRPEKVRV